MSAFIIRGGVPLCGEVEISRAKNAVLPQIAAALLSNGEVTLCDVPDLLDMRAMLALAVEMGASVSYDGRDLRIRGATDPSARLDYELCSRTRASVLTLGVGLALNGKANIALPGGCPIGNRPIDQHLKGLRRMGADIEVDHGIIKAVAREGKLHGAEIYLDVPSVGATQNLLFAAVGAEGTTVIANASVEPEVVDVTRLLVKMGASIDGVGTERLTVKGGQRLGEAKHMPIADRMEAGTFLAAGAATRGCVTVKGVEPSQLVSVMAKLEECGCRVSQGDESVTVEGTEQLRAIDVKTMPYPGFPTDLQAPMASLCCTAQGLSVVEETVFENRFSYTDELKRFGANIKIKDRSALISGGERLSGTRVRATDLRGGAAMIIAGLCAVGTTEVGNIGQIDRGYASVENKLSSLGAKIWRI